MLQHIATGGVAKRTQHVVPNNAARCCVETLRAFGQAFLYERIESDFALAQYTAL